MNGKLEVKFPDMDRDCEDCRGLGYRYAGGGDKKYSCIECDGKGKILTEAGEELIEFIRRHLEK